MYSDLDRSRSCIPALSGLEAQSLDFDSRSSSIVGLLTGLIKYLKNQLIFKCLKS